MIRKTHSLLWVVAIGFWAMPCLAQEPAEKSREPEKAKESSAKESPDKAKESSGKAKQSAEKAKQKEPRLAGGLLERTNASRESHRIASIQSLQRLTEETITLSPGQLEAVRRTFADFIEDLRANAGRPKVGDPNRPNKIYPPTMAQLNDQLAAAEKANDQAKVEEIQRQMSLMRREPSMNIDDQSDRLIEAVKKELKGDQVAEFERVAARWNATRQVGPQAGPFEQLGRALADPEVGLTVTQREEATKIIQDGLAELRKGSDRTLEARQKHAAKAKSEVFEKLTPAQRAKVDANIKRFQNEDVNGVAGEAKVPPKKEQKQKQKQAQAQPEKETSKDDK